MVKKQVEDDGLDKIMALATPSPEYEVQRATYSKKVHFSISPCPPGILLNLFFFLLFLLFLLSTTPPSSKTSAPLMAGTAEGMLQQENKRLETRIQSLNSDLFKERSTNADLSQQVKGLLSELEQIKRRSIHPSLGHGESEEADEDEGEGSGVRETDEDVLAKIEEVEIKDPVAAVAAEAEIRAPSPRYSLPSVSVS